MARGTIVLIGTLVTYLIPDEGRSEDSMDPLSDLIPGIIRRLSRFETADPAQAPMVAGVLTAAVLGQDTLAWRDQYGEIPPTESLAHSFVLWLLSDLIDYTTEQAGTADRLLQEVFSALVEEPS
ncbi:hypothetical protein [Streptomyces sp. NPDC059863]|uniref:hypothetical protein n=1 Tax=unclassified Streptomyces TaxID=2593676 RepID=UPI0036674078